MEPLRFLQIDLDFIHGELNQAPRDLFGIQGRSYFMYSKSKAGVELNGNYGRDGNSSESRLDLKRDGRTPTQTETGGTCPRSDVEAFFSQ
jgi:hypothetical protein